MTVVMAWGLSYPSLAVQHSTVIWVVGDVLVGFLNAMGGPVHRNRHATTFALGVRQSQMFSHFKN